MRIRIVYLSFVGLVFLAACNANEFDLDKDPLEGMIGGDEWAYQSGNARSTNSSLISGMILAGEPTDPCAVVVTTSPHITIIFPSLRGNYNIGVPSDNVNVVFNLQGGSVKYTATSGYVDIVSLTGTEAIGFLSADFDENNTVQGSFALNFCD